MSLYNRAAQFASFDALAGYSDMVVEEARQTDTEVILDEDTLQRLNQKMSVIADVTEDGYRPEIRVRYFVPDSRKAGGEYAEYCGPVKKVDTVQRKLLFAGVGHHPGESSEMPCNGSEQGQRNIIAVDIDRIVEIHGELVDYLDDTVM